MRGHPAGRVSQLSHFVFCRCISSWMPQRVEATLWAKQMVTCRGEKGQGDEAPHPQQGGPSGGSRWAV